MSNIFKYDDRTKCNIYLPMQKAMKAFLECNHDDNSEIDEKFNDPRMQFMNKSVKNGNYYIVDKYNLVIRKNEQNSKKSPYGWILDESGDPINIHIDRGLIRTGSSDILTVTLQHLKQDNPNIFKGKRGVLYKVYTTLPELGVDISKI